MAEGVQSWAFDLSKAQAALGVAAAGKSQAIIPMSYNEAGDPQTLDKSWTGGSMWWMGWDDIHNMQAKCAKEPVLIVSQPGRFLCNIILKLMICVTA